MTKQTEQVKDKSPVVAPPQKSSERYRRERDSKMVKGKFHFHELSGGVLEFNYHAYKGDQVDKYRLVDGQIYTLPLGVARHLNKNVAYPEYSYLPGEDTIGATNSEDGVAMRVKRMVRRCSFESLEFIADEEMQKAEIDNNVVEVEKVTSSIK